VLIYYLKSNYDLGAVIVMFTLQFQCVVINMLLFSEKKLGSLARSLTKVEYNCILFHNISQ